jgi:hypothetical protein
VATPFDLIYALGSTDIKIDQYDFDCRRAPKFIQAETPVH